MCLDLQGCEAGHAHALLGWRRIEGDSAELLWRLLWGAEVQLEQVLGHIEARQAACTTTLASNSCCMDMQEAAVAKNATLKPIRPPEIPTITIVMIMTIKKIKITVIVVMVMVIVIVTVVVIVMAILRVIVIVITIQRCPSQEASGVYDAGRLPPDRLALSIMNVVVQLEHKPPVPPQLHGTAAALRYMKQLLQRTAKRSTAQHDTAWHSIAWYRPAHHSTVQHGTAQHGAA